MARRKKEHDFVIGLAELAQIFGLSRMRIRQYVDEGMPQISRGKYDLVACVNWVIAWWKRKPDPDDSELSFERLKLYRSQRVKTDLENARTRGELIPAEEVADAFNAMAAEVTTRLDPVAGRLAPRLAGLNKPAEVQSLLLTEMREIRTSIADVWDKLAEQEARREAAK